MIKNQSQIYFIYGNQSLEIEEKKYEIISTFLPTKEEQKAQVVRLNAQDYYKNNLLKEDELIKVLKNHCGTISFFNALTIIDFNNLQFFKLKKEGQKNSLLEFLQNSFQHLPTGVIFIFSAFIRKTSEISRPLYALFKKHAKEIRTLITYDDFHPVSWLIQRAKLKGINLTTETADFLIEFIGNDLSVLDKELDKLSLLYDNGSLVTVDQLFKSASSSKKINHFRIVEFLGYKDLDRVIENLETAIFQNQNDCILIFIMIAQHFQRLLKIKYFLNNQISEQLISQKLKINPWILKGLIKQVRLFSMLELEQIVITLSESDLKIKYAGHDGALFLNHLCYQICQEHFKQKNYDNI